MNGRAQSTIIGVAILVAVTALSIGAVTMAAGSFVNDGVAASNTQRVADDFASLDERETDLVRVEFSQGTLRTEPRTVQVLAGGETVTDVEVDALVYETGDRRVTYLSGVVVEGTTGQARLRDSPPIVVGDDRVFVDVVALNATGSGTIGGSDPTFATVRTTPVHGYRTLDETEFEVAIETATPAAWERAFSAAGLTHSRRDFDEDGVPSVVVEFSTSTTLDLAVTDLRAVVRRG